MANKQHPTILLVEAGRTLDEVLRTILQSAGYEVIAAGAGSSEALAAAGKHHPDLIVVNLNDDGFAFLRELAGQTPEPEAKIIALGSYDTPDKINEAHRLGAERYLQKAWTSPKTLLSVVSHTLAA